MASFSRRWPPQIRWWAETSWDWLSWWAFIIASLNPSHTFITSPWYNCTGWLGVKHQLTYLLTYSFITQPVEVPLRPGWRTWIYRRRQCASPLHIKVLKHSLPWPLWEMTPPWGLPSVLLGQWWPLKNTTIHLSMFASKDTPYSRENDCCSSHEETVKAVQPIACHEAFLGYVFTVCNPLCSTPVFLITSGPVMSHVVLISWDVAFSVFLKHWNLPCLSLPNFSFARWMRLSSIAPRANPQAWLNPSKKWALQCKK